MDISFNNSLAIKCTDYVVRRLDGKAYLRDILLILKAWLKHKGQGTVYTGGMGGYSIALTLMGFIAVSCETVTAVMQTRKLIYGMDFSSIVSGLRPGSFRENLPQRYLPFTSTFG